MKQWYKIVNAATTAEVYIYEEIGEMWGEGVGAKAFTKDLNAITAARINLRINSPGGNVFDAFAIYNALVRHPARVETDIDGLAASAASYVALAGNEVRMAENAQIMIHNPSGGSWGDAAGMRKMAEILDQIKDSIVGIYGARLDASEAIIRQWMDEESWFGSEKAKALGFVDQITPNLSVSNSFNLSRFRHVPKALAQRPARDRYQPLFARLAQAVARQTGKGAYA